jgi:hypothetical protein
MKRLCLHRFALAAAVMTLPLSALAVNSSANNTASSSTTMTPGQPGAQMEADHMVRANAALLTTLDAKDMHDGNMFRARLSSTARLDNGMKLAAGTMLMGKVVADDMNMQGTSKLALRITEAKLRDGQIIPVKATIVGVALPGQDEGVYPATPGNQVPNEWNKQTLQVDQISVLKGVDLHSNIGSQNSGVFVSKTKDNVKLRRDTELELAIAPTNHGPMA